MASELEIIEKIAQEIGQEIPQIEKIDFWQRVRGYLLNSKQHITGLALSHSRLRDISFLETLPNLTQLDLSDNQISDISVLRKLQSLTWLNLSFTQISDITMLKALPTLTQLDLTYSQVRDISVLKEMPNLTWLIFGGNQISDISVLRELPNLTRLYLWDNQINDISTLKELPNLIELNLGRNQISDISVLRELPNLTRLYLWDNQISDISVLRELPNLTALSLNSTQTSDISVLRELPNLTALSLNSTQTSDISVLRELPNLTELSLNSTQTSDISVLRELPNLTMLFLSSIQLRDISVLKTLSNLSYLDLSGNQLSDISVLKELPNLTWLNLGGNQLRDISVLKTLSNLFYLDLSGNQLSDISVLRKLPNLKELILSNMQIGDISVLKTLSNLFYLDLSGNQLSDISVLRKLPNLKELILSNMQIGDISVLKELPNLAELNLSNTQIADISVLKGLPNLTDLNLSNTQIRDISMLKKLSKLTRLNLQNNQLFHLSREILDWRLEIKWEWDLEGLILEGNPLKLPPVEIVQNGHEAVKDYFHSIEAGARALNEVKVLLVGEGAAGKTSLVKQLLGEKFDKHESQTHGINIRRWQVLSPVPFAPPDIPGLGAVPEEQQNLIQVHFWDFGGQEIMHATHQFFLSKRSLYILVLDGRKEEKTEYWLKHIESFGGDSPILVVINKVDENPGFDLNRVFLQEKYNGIKGFFRVSCSTQEGVEELKERIAGALTETALFGSVWAESWFRVKTHLESMDCEFITYPDYQALCEKEAVNDDSTQDTLVDFLNDLGIILHFKEFELEDTHVLDPRWVTEAVYKIINSKILADNRGILKLRDLKEILAKKKKSDYFYSHDKYRYIIELMKKFELCYEIDSQTVLIPDLLEVQEPRFEFDYANSLKFIIDYDFFPKSIMPRFIVKMHKDISGNLRWRTGVVLQDKNFDALAAVKADEEAKKIYIYVSGEQKRDYFAAILYFFREINNSFEKLKYVEKVPMPGEPHITVSYKHLLTLEKKGVEKFIPDGSEKEYKVRELLGIIQSERRSEEEILRILRKLEDKIIDESTFMAEANKIIELKPNLFGIGINLNELAKQFFSRKRKR